jgi:hypothetical protein
VIDGQLVGGVAAAAAAAVCFNGAVVLYAIEGRHVSAEHGLRLSLVRQIARRPLWLAALALDGLGWPFQLLALSLAPLTVVQPTLSVGLLLLLAVGARRLGEHVGRLEVAATVAIVGGVTGLALAAPPHSNATPDPVPLALLLGALVLLCAAPYALRRRREVGAGTMIVAAGSAFTATALSSKLLTDELANGHWVAALAWGLGTAAVAALGLLSEISALQRFEATRVSPAIFVIQTVAPVIAAPILIGEDWGSTPGGGAVLVAALAATCAGGALLARSRVVAGAHDESDQAPAASSSTRSAAAGSPASDRSGSRGDASAERSAAASSAGVDATSANPKRR